MWYSKRVRPLPSLSILVSSPRRRPNSSITAPWFSSGTSTVKFSYGSHFCPSISRNTTRGLPTANSKPSRRIFSSKMVKCNSPRPDTRNTSASAVSSTRKATLVSNSRVKRSRIWRLVTNLPSVPANGDVFTIKSMVKVGSSTLNIGTPTGFSLSQMVTPMPISSMPEIITMSPASASSCGTRSKPLKPSS